MDNVQISYLENSGGRGTPAVSKLILATQHVVDLHHECSIIVIPSGFPFKVCSQLVYIPYLQSSKL
jgi:hypothetical protein